MWTVGITIFLIIVAWGLFNRWCDDRELRRQHKMLRKYSRKLDEAERKAGAK